MCLERAAPSSCSAAPLFHDKAPFSSSALHQLWHLSLEVQDTRTSGLRSGGLKGCDQQWGDDPRERLYSGHSTVSVPAVFQLCWKTRPALRKVPSQYVLLPADHTLRCDGVNHQKNARPRDCSKVRARCLLMYSLRSAPSWSQRFAVVIPAPSALRRAAMRQRIGLRDHRSRGRHACAGPPPSPGSGTRGTWHVASAVILHVATMSASAPWASVCTKCSSRVPYAWAGDA